MAIIAPNPKWQVFNAGAIGAGCKLYTYDTGTSTPRPTYTSSTQAVANTNPVVFDSRGEAVIYFNGTYKLVLKDPSDVTLWTVDNFDPAGSDQNVAYDNLIQNGSFETLGIGTLPSDWDVTLYTNGAGARVSDSVFHGGYALKFTSVGSGGGQAVGAAFTECSEGMPMSVMFALRSDVADVRNVAEIYWYDKNKSQLAGGSAKTTLYDDATTNPTAWTVYRYFPVPPADARYCKVRLVGCDSSDATVGNTWFDGVSVGDIPLVNSSGVLYFPGDATITGAFKTGDGAAATPAVRRTATADGLFWAAGVVGVSIAGVEKGRFTSTGLNGCAIGATTTSTGAFTTGTFSSTLGVTGDFAINTNKFTVTAASGNTTVAGTLGVTGDFAVATNKFTVAAATGNTTVAGTLGVTGAVTLSSTLGVTGDFSVATNKFTVAAATGNTTVAGTLGVTGAITGNVTGNVTGSSGSCTGNAATATTATNVSGGTASVTTLAITQGAIISGTYTPTSDAGTPHLSYYLRVGNIVTVTGSLDHTTNVVVRISLPFSTTFTHGSQISGVASGYNETTNSLYGSVPVFVDVSGGDTNVVAFGTAAASCRNNFHFTYTIL